MTRIKFLGAREGVTGSKSLITKKGKNFLVDCGLFQGPKAIRELNWNPLEIEPLDGVILTHAHLDHSGYLPRLVKQGYEGPIYCSFGTADLCDILLRDAAYLEEEYAEYANRTGFSNHKPALPLFRQGDVEKVLKLIRPIERNQWIELDVGISFELLNAGHIVGASMIRFSITDDAYERGPCFLSFSGDLGHNRSWTMRPPDDPPPTDILILESTYGDRLHPRDDPDKILIDVVSKTAIRKGVVVIPAFAVGRAQELIFRIGRLQRQAKIPNIPVVLDSPMAKEATRIFMEHQEDHNYEFKQEGDFRRLFPPRFEISASSNDSMMQCMRDGPLVVISASGMLTGGRVLHHLKRRLPFKENTILFSGYQAEGTKGRYLQEIDSKDKTLRIHHEEVPVNAEILTLDSLSSHADFEDIIEWLKRATSLPKSIYLNHGSTHSQRTLATKIGKEFGIDCYASCDHPNFELCGTKTKG